ncbi:zinc-binding dehydrogenase [Nocardia arthritidis]|uniref:Zinc-binding dehydrogenase n=1 Tax=Nocardia arthritidis TaxID=228602 RepID=A0A6G9YBJ8_9NOCA|nr:zinc-binding dehydrogenase [Nocardia arthritidis]QIS10645.1 zinc-binding dehydrogenase [Nocardia arthritidis]
MRAVYATEFGGPEVLRVRETPDPAPGPGEVVVDVAAADVMFLDTRLRGGWGTQYFKLTPPYVPGGAVAGVVTAVGPGVAESWLGKRVSTITAASGIGSGTPTGGYAEKALAKADSLIEVPDELGPAQAVAVAHDGRTALGVHNRAALQPGEWVLITAAGGGLGILLIQLARAAGAQVIAAARGTTKLELVTRLGADAVIDYTEPGWADKARAITGGSGVHVVFDGAGGDLGATALDAIADGGRFLGYGASAGEFATMNREAAAARGITVIDLREITAGETDWHGLAERALREAAEGRLEVVIGQSFPLHEADRAHAAIENREAIGRTVLVL